MFDYYLKMQNNKKYQVKAGRFEYDIETKKVKLSKAKGQLSIFTVLN